MRRNTRELNYRKEEKRQRFFFLLRISLYLAVIVYFALACGLAYMLSGYFSLYSSQKIMYSKLKAEFINIHAR